MWLGNRHWKRLTLIFGGTLLSSFILYAIFEWRYRLNFDDSSIYFDDGLGTNQKSVEKFDAGNKATIQWLTRETIEEDVRGSDLYSGIYDQIFTNHKVESVIGNLNFEQRCQLYFKNLYVKDHNWFLDPNESMTVQYKAEYRKFKQENHARFKKEFDKKKEKPEDYGRSLEAFIKSKYEEFKNNEDDEFPQRLVEYFTTLRIFNKCYVTNDDPNQISRMKTFVEKQQKMIAFSTSSFQSTDAEKLSTSNIDPSSFEHRVYTWLTFEYPVYEHWTGVIIHDIPDMKSEIVRAVKTKREASFLKEFKNKINGKGIVITLPDTQVDNLVSLIRLLRALQNKLPIQIVNFESLSFETKSKLVTAARDDIDTLPSSYANVSEQLGPDYFNQLKGGLPKQEIWFVSINNAIHKNYRNSFKKFGNKFLAMMFNSFEECMLIDADTAMLKNPEYFFNMKSYKKTGALLFRDRTIVTENTHGLFKKIGPSIIDSAMFDIPIMTKYTLDREFFHGLTHYIESGLVLMNRKLHFSSALVSGQTYFFVQIRDKVYGDKELFWLGMVINGDENYHVNEIAAAAVGKLTNPQDRLRPDGSEHTSQELCSAHPGHISDEDGHTLLWVNSGFSVCIHSEILDYEEQANFGTHFKNLAQTAEAFREFFTSPLIIEHAVVAAYSDPSHHRNIEDEPTRGWKITKYCKGYMWCSFSSIGGETKEGNNNSVQGKIVSFDEGEIALFKYYVDTYLGIE
ncbi:putative alpha-13-mannosyltransferase MNN1 [Spathaspora sp. JA1]|nr:putative alpha-13-mannosyltransferase MNN1 [Spathaspora sp. JA1]